MPRRALLALALAASLAPGAVTAQDAGGLHVSGFGTVGVVSQSGAEGWRLLRNSAQAAAGDRTSATPDSRAGVQLNWSGDGRWEAALQAVAMRKPPGAAWSDRIEWAYLGARVGDGLRVRLGRTSPDMFLYADSRNVGYALPWARPPVDFYGFAPIAAIDGLDLEQRWPSGDAQWRARLTAGRFSVSTTAPDGSRLPIEGRDTLAAAVSRDEGGLLLKATYLHARLAVQASPELLQLRDGLSQLAALPVPGLAGSIAPLQRNLWTTGPVTYFGFGAQFDHGPWTLAGELSSLSVPDSPLDARRGYASLGYRVHQVTWYALASRVLPREPAAATPDLRAPLTPLLGAPGAAAAQQLVEIAGAASVLYRYDQRTIGAGLRWDVLPNGSLKFQVDRFKVHPNGSAGWVNGDPRAAQGTLTSLVFDFVWGE